MLFKLYSSGVNRNKIALGFQQASLEKQQAEAKQPASSFKTGHTEEVPKDLCKDSTKEIRRAEPKISVYIFSSENICQFKNNVL